jgi:hypothetical protein
MKLSEVDEMDWHIARAMLLGAFAIFAVLLLGASFHGPVENDATVSPQGAVSRSD